MSPSSRTRSKKKIILQWLGELLKSTQIEWLVHRATSKEMYSTFLQTCDIKHKTLFSSAQNFIEHLNSQLQDTIFKDQTYMKEIYHPHYKIVYDIITLNCIGTTTVQ